VTAVGPPIAMRGGNGPIMPPKTFTIASIPPSLVTRDEPAEVSGPPRRTKLWEFNTNLHCSIIGTCLSTAELRQLLKKVGLAPVDSSDHDLHGAAVSLAARHDKASKLLNKALDERHRIAIHQFAKVHTEEEVRSLWREFVKRGEIPGAYWATLTHEATTAATIRDAFGEVHMLSHLVGSANRADIRRLCQMEEENARLRARLEKQQLAFGEAVVTRDATIRELRHALAERLVSGSSIPDEHSGMSQHLIADLERRLATETRRSVVLAKRLSDVKLAAAEERTARANAERETYGLRRELDTIETAIHIACCDSEAGTDTSQPRLNGVTLLYVGGRPHHIAQLRAIAQKSGATFAHHDGGIEHHLNLLPGLASQADLIVFPVDCISHHAAQLAKQLCRQTGKRLIPLRSASATSLLAVLQRPDVTNLADAAD
jgi:hypothetical protein